MVSPDKRALFSSISKESMIAKPLVKKVSAVRAEYIPSKNIVVVRNKKKEAKSAEQAYAMILALSIVPADDVRITDIFPEEPLPDLKVGAYVLGEYPIVVTGTRLRTTVSEVYRIPLDLKVIPDAQENKLRDEYFEGILQVRNADKEVIRYAYQQVALENNAEVSKEEHIAEGAKDLYFTNKKPLRKVAQALQRRFGGEVRGSKKIFTMDKDTQKDIYRDTVLFRRYNVAAGDIALHKDIPYLIIKVTKQIVAQDVVRNQNVVFGDDSQLVKVAWQKASVISKDPLQALDPITHETYAPQYFIGDRHDVGDSVDIARISEHCIIARASQ